MTRSNIIILKGVNSASPKIVGIFDHAGNMLDSNFDPIPTQEANQIIEDIVECY